MVREPDPRHGGVTVTTLLADIGGTHARFRLLDGDRLLALPTVAVSDFPTVETAIAASMAGHRGARMTLRGCSATRPR